MSEIKVGSEVEEEVWTALKEHASESNQSVSGVLTEAISEYLARRRARPNVMRHLEDSIRENHDLGKKLAQ